MEEEAWPWLDEDFKLDTESPLAISRSLWDDFASNEAVVRSLFPSASASHDVDDSVSPALSLGKPDSPERSISWDFMPDCRSRPLKRRCLLQLCDVNLIDTSQCVSELLERSSDSLVGPCENVERNGPSLPNSMWYIDADGSRSLADDGGVEQTAENWMAVCISDSDTSDVQEIPPPAAPRTVGDAGVTVLPPQQSAETHRWHSDSVDSPFNPAALKSSSVRVTALVHKSRCTLKSATMSHLKQSKDIPGKMQIKRRAHGKPSQPLQVKDSASPVLAYPFALVKPSGIQGDVTLQDINQRINMASSVVVSSPKDAFKGSPSRLSGKSVLALTKIQTEGKGTITIMRTRG